MADFLLEAERIEVFAQEKAEELAELRFLGPVLSYWLEKRGVATLHASAVATARGVVAFLSRKEGGKTGLAAAFLRAGAQLVTDDVLAIEETAEAYLARPGYPRMRMWPDEARWYSPDWEALPLVHPAVSKRWVPVGDFVEDALALSVLLIPQRVPDGPVELETISPRDALIELVRHSFSPRLMEAAGLQARRLDLLARLALEVPVRRLRYPSGFERLPEVVAALTSGDAW